MVQSKSDRERQKLITDKCQALIEVLLKDDDNKYCVDCDAKGPRWASWNLGIFLCIRCAGIHRNLGVHISRVKSVNLDAWAPDHVAYVQRMGNSRARAIYEANLPDDFRRPQTDTALESFIRAKYEHKKYIAQDYVDPGPPEPAFNVDEELKRMKEQKRSKLTGGNNKTILSVSDSFAASMMAAAPSNQASSTAIQHAKPSLATNSVSKPRVLSSELGILSQKQQQSPQMLHDIQSNSGTKPKSALADLIDLDLGFGAQPSSNITNKFDLNNPINSNSNFNTNSAFEFGQLFAAIPQVQDSQQRQHQNPSNIASLANFVSTASISTPSSAPTVAPTMLIPSAIGTSKTQTPKPSTDSPANNLMGGSAGKNVFDLLDL